jgi:formylglycine-generating enzyme required for sulfatase activity
MKINELIDQRELSKLREQLNKLESLRPLLGDELTDQKKSEVQTTIQALVNTVDGALVNGDVDIHNGDFVGRDKLQIILGNQYSGVSLDKIPLEVLLRAYLRILATESSQLPLNVLDPQFMSVKTETPILLTEVYIDQALVTSVREEPSDTHEVPFVRLTRRASGKRIPLLATITHQNITRFVLLGDTGAGKTTFANYLTYILITGGNMLLWSENTPNNRPLPFRLILREVAARHIPPDEAKGHAGMLWNALRDDMSASLGAKAADALFPYYQQRLFEDGCFVILDGLDEVPEADRRRKCLLEAISELETSLPAKTSRIIVTARPYIYADPNWRLYNFQPLVLAPFDNNQVEIFVNRWYQAVSTIMGWDEITAQGRGEKLLEALFERPYLADLATRPLLLTLMASLHTSWGQLPRDYADLYEETVKLLVSRWQRAREVKGPDGKTVIEPGILRVLEVEESSIRRAIHQLAYQVHERQGRGAEREEIPASIGRDEVLAAFASLLPADFNPKVLLNYLETRAGLLIGQTPDVYTFPHRSFQEYLAACHLSDKPDVAREFRKLIENDLEWWREIFLFGVGKIRQGGLGNAVHIVNTLVPESYSEVFGPIAFHWRSAILAGRALTDLNFPEVAQGEVAFEVILKRVRQWLLALLDTPNSLPFEERAEAGDVLGELGDPRPGISIIERANPKSLPNILWVEVPSGSFLMGSREENTVAETCEKPQHSLSLPVFLVSRYPITNSQYQAFVNCGGYDNPKYWTSEGWGWRTGEREPDLSLVVEDHRRERYAEWLRGRSVEKRNRPFWWGHLRSGLPRRPMVDSVFRAYLPNRPVVGVNWYEATAYCCWLTEQLRMYSNKHTRIWQFWNIDQFGGLEHLLDDGLRHIILESDFVVRLPSEAEWEKAARGEDGRCWPWGNEWSPGYANTAEAGIGQTSTTGVFQMGASPYGVLDMADRKSVV